ncbi:MAG: hypothetical protein HN704_04695 [Bacteroidetes bacterium]|nr:hypothetical protein [Bacteroidota bacterium]MBT6686010.1 hypothetical protein [Bacteroidota bacterium]MBT7143792.1 hypothetical protein [Bacteroidota bacterium]MBT7490891.1 hypothetical protein [Bacteroidota bacterium]
MDKIGGDIVVCLAYIIHKNLSEEKKVKLGNFVYQRTFVVLSKKSSMKHYHRIFNLISARYLF